MQNTVVENQRIHKQWRWILDNQFEVRFGFPLPDFSFLSNYFSEEKLQLKTTTVRATEPLVEPALKNLDAAVLDSLQQACLMSDKPEWLLAWSEKLLRVCEIRRLTLHKRLLTENEDKSILKVKTLRLCLFFLNLFFICNDARYVNVVLKIIDLNWLKFKGYSAPTKGKMDVNSFLEALVMVTADVAQAIIESADWHTDIVGPYDARVVRDVKLPMCKVFEESPQVVAFSPNQYGLLTLCIAELLRIHGIKVRGIVVRKLLNPKRLIQEVRRDGYKWVYKKIKEKLLLRKISYHSLAFDTLPDYCDDIQLRHNSVAKWCDANSSEMVVCNELNDLKVCDYLKNVKPELVVFCGGGVISEETIKLSGAGILNCHGGLLPRYRGFDNFAWPLLEKHIDVIGCTTHFMSRYVDEGDILLMQKVDIGRMNNIDNLNKYMEIYQVKLLVYTAIKYLKNEILPFAQRKDDGKQYFYMHPKLVEVAQQNLIRHKQC